MKSYRSGKSARKQRAFDHDHDTLKIRGILCNKCNFLIGLSNENIEVLKNSIIYLEHWVNTESEFYIPEKYKNRYEKRVKQLAK